MRQVRNNGKCEWQRCSAEATHRHIPEGGVFEVSGSIYCGQHVAEQVQRDEVKRDFSWVEEIA